MANGNCMASTTWLSVSKSFTLPGVDAMPFADQLPSPKELVDASFDFLAELVAAQKELSDKLFDLVDAKSAA